MATLLEEDEVLGIAQNSYEWDLGGCGGREDVNHEHSQDLTASTSRREINNNSLGSNDEVFCHSAMCFEESGNDFVAEASGRNNSERVHCSRVGALLQSRC